MKSKIRKFHMIGIGGAGMSAIAEILLQLGYEISGSDLAESRVLEYLRGLGAVIHVGHEAANLGGAQVVIKSTAITDDNPEIAEARRRGLPIMPRSEMLAELMRIKQGVAIAGTHGKTTTTSFTASIFDAAGLDPTVLIGGRLNVYGANARLGAGEYLIAEADESDGSFLRLSSVINIVTNIDDDHLDHYGDRKGINEAFLQFMNQAPFFGLNVICGDDPGIRALLPGISRPYFTYGLGADCSLRGEVLETGRKSRFAIWRGGNKLGEVRLPQPGRHNVLNALGAIGAALAADIDFEKCVEGLENFKGVGRRFEFRGEKDGVTVIDDYGHHPAELAATLAAAREVFPGRRLVAAFQPHRFSRTKALFEDFCRVFKLVDTLLLTDIYAASENPIPGVSGESLADGARRGMAAPVYYCPTLDDLLFRLKDVLRPGDVFLTLGAGSITKLGPAWLAGSAHA